jgi:hypothetical protein
MKKPQSFEKVSKIVPRWLASRWFWWLTIGLFVLQSSYVALVGRFSMAFDEYYHLGTIQAYTKVWLPWSVQQPPGDAPIGAITADGSYLYHYLISFPYRLLEHITSNATAQIITLRLIDVGIVVLGFYVFRRLLLRLGLSRWMTHAILFFLSLLPMTPFLAGQLTYDSLWFTMTAVTVLLMLQLVDHIRGGSLPLKLTALTLSSLLLTSQIKYAFLPMALAGGVFMLVFTIHQVRSHKLSMAGTWSQWRSDVRQPISVGVLVLAVISSVFFAARYGNNIIKYHNPVPACNAVISTERCMAYGPFGRDENHRQLHFDQKLTTAKKVAYPFGWFHHMVLESYFAVGPKEIGYQTGKPLPVSYRTGFVLAIAATVLLIVKGRYLWRRSLNDKLILSLVITYTLFLFASNYQAYLTTGVPVAIHGRYMLALLPLIAYLLNIALRSYGKWKVYKLFAPAIVTIILLATFYGGGIAPFILRSNDGWYWQAARPISNTVRSIISPVVWH